MADSTVTVVGNLTRDPELRFTTGGRAICNLGIAVSRRYQVNNEWQEQTSFFNVTAWGDLGQNVAASCGKGARVIVTGRIEQRTWETTEGEKRSAVDIIADEIGPSLRWARCEIERVVREQGGPAQQQQQQPPAGNQHPGTYDPVINGEEPF